MTAIPSTLEKNPDLRYSVEAAGDAAHQVTGQEAGMGPVVVDRTRAHDPALRRTGRAGR